MTPITKLVRLATALVIAAALGACGGSTKSPVAPSSSATPAASAAQVPTSTVTGGATIDGTVVGVAGAQRLGVRPMGTGPAVSVAGTPISSPIDPMGHFSLQGVPTGDVQLQVTANGATATLPVTGVSTNEQIHLTITVSGSSATADDSDRETTDNGAEVEGKITAISGSTLTVAGKSISVPAGTPIRHGGTAIPFSALVVGERIHVHGTKAGTGVTATSIEVQTDNPGNPGAVVPTPPPNPGNPGNDDDNEAEVSGTVSARAGSCPTLGFTVGTTAVTTNASTQFVQTSCATLANGNKVEVKGTKQANGSLLASRVKLDK